MKSKALGKTYAELDKQHQLGFNFPMASKKYGPETSFIAEESMTEDGTREKHCKRILAAMYHMRTTRNRPATGAQIADISGMSIVQVMRRLRTDLAQPGFIECTEKKILCGLTHKYRFGWWIK